MLENKLNPIRNYVHNLIYDACTRTQYKTLQMLENITTFLIHNKISEQFEEVKGHQSLVTVFRISTILWFYNNNKKEHESTRLNKSQ